YLNRYERTESQLSAVNIFPDKMYDSEAKGYRLLERARLSPDAQRLVLIGAGYQINSKAISESMLMSFPEHKPPPVLHGRDGQPIQRYNHGGKGGKPQQTTTFPNGAAPSKSYGKGGKKGKFSPHRHTAYITEADDQDQIDDQPNDEPEFYPELEDIPEHEPDHDDQTDQFEECVGDEPTYDDYEGDDTAPAEIAEVADVLTLTAQRLKATTLGRKFSGNKSIEERKKSSHCSACGVLGHWSGDPVCTKSSKGGKGSKGTRAKPDSRSKGHRDQDAQPKKVLFTVNVPDNHDDNPVNHSTSETIPYYAFMTNYAVNVVFDTFISQESFSGLMILDTACQRTCCGPQWLKSHEQLLHSKNLQTHVTPNSELFQFGRGAPVKSTSRVYLPSIIGDVECLIGAAIVNTQIPLLASNNFLEHMRAVLDFSKGIVILKTIGKTVPLHRISGHLAIEIANFSAGADSSPTMIVIRLMSLEWTCLRYMSMMVKRGLAHRVWLTLHLRQEEWIDQRKDVGKVRIMSEVQPEASVVRQAAALPVTDETDLYLDTMVADDGMDFIETFSDEGWELKRLTGKVNNALHAITKEHQIYQTNYLYCKSRADIMEAFAGSAKISKMSSAYGLKAVTPLDFNTGVDLSTKHGQDICNSLMDRYHPLFFFAEIDCRPWVLLQDNVNFLHRPHELQSWRDSVRRMVARTASWCLKQHNAGRYFLIENPDNSRLWAEPTIDELRQLTNAFEVKCHHGAYGATNSKGQLIRKTFRFLTNNQHMANALMRKLSPEALQQCVPLEGKEVTLSQEYSDGLVKEMLKAVRRTAQELQPARFAPRRAHQVLANFAYSEPEPDAAAIMEQVKEFFTRTSLKTTLLNPQEILYQDIQRLIPWNLNRLQLASTPITFRQPGHVPHTHRGAVLLYAGDEIPSIISEDISQ
ncbi:unnamed protein product, partial [Effrenium voratum]